MEMSSYQSYLNINTIYERLKTISGNPSIIEKIQQCLKSWDYDSISTIEQYKEDIDQVVEELRSFLFANIESEEVSQLIKEFILCDIYDKLFGFVKKCCIKEDIKLYEVSKRFCKTNGSPKQLGDTFYSFVPKTAVVELSMLSTLRTPLEKLKCLLSFYDYIFAEVKGNLISVISKYSDKEIDIPFIDNKEVIPIVMAVILKSKLFYPWSELFYIKHLGGDHLENHKNFSEVFKVYEESLNNILKLENFVSTCMSKTKTLNDTMTVCETINFIEKQHNVQNVQNGTVFSEEKKRVATLISKATTEELIE
ncbi:hypothetical protein ABEB36_014985 [Hypothenemus hampei]|uniref:VPS9 domain-containing protein n=1 Tax=Hypothenemus hampei TaxID=57062 RepID=A0ABD1E1R4_HYPHA